MPEQQEIQNQTNGPDCYAVGYHGQQLTNPLRLEDAAYMAASMNGEEDGSVDYEVIMVDPQSFVGPPGLIR